MALRTMRGVATKRRIGIGFVNILLVCLLGLVNVVMGAECGPWEWANPLPQGEKLNAAAYGNGRHVAVSHVGTVVTSDNGITWSVQDIGVREELRGIIWGGDRFVAVGAFAAASADGLSWTTANMPASSQLQSVAWDGTQFVAVGGSIVTSSDGANWTVVADSPDLLDIVWGGGKFVAVGASGWVMTSSDGTNWTSHQIGGGDGLFGIAWNGQEYLAVGAYGVAYSSPNGEGNWTQVKPYGSGQWLYDVTWDGGRFVAVGAVGSAGLIFTSEDGVTWNEPVNWNRDYWLAGVTSGGGQLLAVGNGGMMLTSPDGDDWQQHLLGVRETMNDVVRGEEEWIAVGEAGTILSSDNGRAWLLEDSGVVASLNGVHWDGSQYLAVGALGTVLSSAEGKVWQLQDSATEATLSDATGNDEQLVAVGEQGTIATSRNSGQWELQSSNTVQDLEAVTWGNELFVAVGNAGTVSTSTDGVTWNSGSVEENCSYCNSSGVVWDDTQFVAVGGEGWSLGPYTSPDAVAWTRQQYPWVLLYDITWVNDELLAVGQVPLAMTSPDGIVWTGEDPGPAMSSQLNGVAWDGNQFIAVGADGAILRKPCGTGAYPLVPGLNLIGIPFDPALVPDVASLLQSLGTPETIDELLRLNPGTLRFERCAFDGAGGTTGEGCSAAPVSGEGWLVRARTNTTVEFDATLACPVLDLPPGLNIVALGCLADVASAFGLGSVLPDLSAVASLQSFDNRNAGWLSATYEAGVPAGEDFSVLSGGAYLLHLREGVSLGPAGPD